MKLYRVSIVTQTEGYADVWAESPGDAREKAKDHRFWEDSTVMDSGPTHSWVKREKVEELTDEQSFLRDA